MAFDKKWAAFAVFVSVIVVLAVVVPIAVYTNNGQSEQAGVSADGGAMSPSNIFLQFGAMILCTTKRNPLEYQGYGCHCGIFNNEGTPVDETDRCCQTHDACLKELETTGVCRKHGKASFMIPYAMKIKGCKGRKPATIECKPQDRYNKVDRALSMGNPACGESLCQCDRQAALCFKRHALIDRFRPGNKNATLCQSEGSSTQPPFPTTAGNPTVAPAGGNSPAPVYRID